MRAIATGLILSAILLVGVYWLSLQEQKTDSMQTLEEKYPLPWKKDFNTSITRALVANNIRVCGEYKYREYYKKGGEFIVACGDSSTNTWVYFIVYTNSKKVTGPYTKL